MSGTSLDGVDAVLVDFAGERLRYWDTDLPFFWRAQKRLLALNTSGADELHRLPSRATPSLASMHPWPSNC